MTSQSQPKMYWTPEVRAASGSSGPGRICAGRVPALALALTGLLMMVGTRGVTAKSLYVIAETVDPDQQVHVLACDIAADGTLTRQASRVIPLYGAGALGLALDAGSQRLFVTYKTSNVIALLDTATLQSVGMATAKGTNSLAGVVYDYDKRLLYCVAPGTPNLYVYQWKSATDELVPLPNSPVRLEGAEAYGIALDETTDKLYVAGSSASVNVYSTSDWHWIKTISVGRVAISVAVDPVRNYLYYGGGLVDNFFLGRHDLVNGTEAQVRIASLAGVVGLAVDPGTGFVFVSTGSSDCYCGHDLLSFNSNLALIDAERAIGVLGNPAGVVVPDGHVSFNPLRLTKTVKTSTGELTSTNGLPQVTVGEELTYTICFDHNNLPLTEVSIVDTLPAELAFVGATGDGTYGHYDSQTHTYTWLNPPLGGGSRQCLELTCRVDPSTPAGQTLTNSVTIDTLQTPSTTTKTDVVTVVAAKVYKPLHLSKTVVAGATGGGEATLASAYGGDEVTYRIFFDNKDNSYPVAHVRLVDNLPPQATFVRATGNILYGSYEPVTNTYTWSYPAMLAGDSNSVDLVVRLNDDAAGGTTITNTATIVSDNTPATRTSVGLTVTGFAPLRLQKTLASGATGRLDTKGRPYVDAGATLTYAICFSNPATNKAVTQIAIVDTLPREVSFVSADGDRDFGSYDAGTHTYTWRSASLASGLEKCLNLTVRVNDKVDPNTVISNSATVSTGQTLSTKARIDLVVGAASKPPATDVTGEMYITPDHIYRNDSTVKSELMVVVHLPEGIGMAAISNTPLLLTPGNVRATGQQIFGTSTQGKALCFFDVDPILAATQGYGEFSLKVTGKLNDGHSFYANGTIWILKFGGP